MHASQFLDVFGLLWAARTGVFGAKVVRKVAPASLPPLREECGVTSKEKWRRENPFNRGSSSDIRTSKLKNVGGKTFTCSQSAQQLITGMFGARCEVGPAPPLVIPPERLKAAAHKRVLQEHAALRKARRNYEPEPHKMTPSKRRYNSLVMLKVRDWEEHGWPDEAA